jgi:hypothetical protein
MAIFFEVGSRMLFARDEPKTSGDGSKTQMQLELELPPNDLLSELALVYRKTCRCEIRQAG